MSTDALPIVVDQADLPIELDGSAVEFEGRDHGASVSVILVSTDEDGSGPKLHRHPYDETFVIRGGAALFTVGDQEVVGRAGQIIVVPAQVPHKFAKTGTERLEMMDVHASPVFITEWLE
jgi:mannose-6-phosphate isomerase-like protein (cupin superfamily)